MSWNSSRYEYVTQSLRSSGDTQVRATAALPQLNPLNFMLCAIWCTKIWISPTKLRKWVINMSKTIHSYKLKRKSQLLGNFFFESMHLFSRSFRQNLNFYECVFNINFVFLARNRSRASLCVLRKKSWLLNWSLNYVIYIKMTQFFW